MTCILQEKLFVRDSNVLPHAVVFAIASEAAFATKTDVDATELQDNAVSRAD